MEKKKLDYFTIVVGKLCGIYYSWIIFLFIYNYIYIYILIFATYFLQVQTLSDNWAVHPAWSEFYCGVDSKDWTQILRGWKSQISLLCYGHITASSLRCASSSIQLISSHSTLVLTYTSILSSAFLLHFIKT